MCEAHPVTSLTLFAGSHVKAMLMSPHSVWAVLLAASQPKKDETLTVYTSPNSKRSFCIDNQQRQQQHSTTAA
jgi:hypothetical protein